MSKNLSNTVLATLSGIAIGLGAGLLLAPEEGRKTRKKIKKSFDEKTVELKTRMNELSNEIKQKTALTKGSLEDNVEHLLSKSSYKAEEVITILEKKLADLKKANSKLQK